MEIDGLRVLLISPLPPPAGGIASWTQKFLDWAQMNRVDVDIVNTAVVGVRAERINTRRSLFDEVRRTIGILFILKQKISNYHPDIVHLNTPCGKFGIMRDYICAIAVKKKRIPLVVHYRCNISDQINGNKLSMFFFRKLTNLADLVFVLNTPSKEYVKKLTKTESQQVANFIDESYIINKLKFISPNIKNILFVGHVQETKGIKEIIEVARLLSDINFILAGPISDKILSMSIPDNIELLGPVDHETVKNLLDKADVFLFPSYTEGFANALVEAMARGVPIITTPVGANADMIEEFGGFLVGVNSVVDIVNAINKISSIKLRKSMSDWNIKKVKINYLIDNVMHNLLKAYKEVLNNEHKTS